MNRTKYALILLLALFIPGCTPKRAAKKHDAKPNTTKNQSDFVVKQSKASYHRRRNYTMLELTIKNNTHADAIINPADVKAQLLSNSQNNIRSIKRRHRIAKAAKAIGFGLGMGTLSICATIPASLFGLYWSLGMAAGLPLMAGGLGGLASAGLTPIIIGAHGAKKSQRYLFAESGSVFIPAHRSVRIAVLLKGKITGALFINFQNCMGTSITLQA